MPVASFLSGGLDSSLITIAAQRHTQEPIRTFTIGFEHSEFDELPYARAVASQAHTQHIEHIVSPRDAMRQLPLLVWHLDEPIGDSSIIPNYLVSKLAAQYVKVCMSGLGGDELFGGYARYLDPGKGRIRSMFSSMPWAAAAFAPLVDRWNFSWAEELRLASSPTMDWRSYLHRIQIFDSRELRNIGMAHSGLTEQIIEQLWNTYPGTDFVSRRQFVDQQTYLPDQILALTDKMSMANSLEVRVPMMDYRLIRFSQALRSDEKQNGKDFKMFLKRVLGKHCPPELLNRPKWGFDTPLRRWVGQPEIYDALKGLPRGTAVKQGLLRGSGVRGMVSSPEIAQNQARRVWNLLILETWLRVHKLETPPGESLLEVVKEAA